MKKKIYVCPRTNVLESNVQCMEIRGSLVYGDGSDGRPEMGKDAKAYTGNDNVRFWNELN